jgi:hypothetical protein
MKWRLLATALGLLLLRLMLPTSADAHRSGCHRWHTCPSDRGTYTEKAAPAARARHPRGSKQSRAQNPKTAPNGSRTPGGVR